MTGPLAQVLAKLTAAIRHLDTAAVTAARARIDAQVVGAAFALAVHRRFGDGYTATDVATLVKETRAQFHGAESLPSLEMEGLIRAALGEVELAETIDPETDLQIQVVMLGKLLHDADFTEPELDAFIVEVEQVATTYL